MNADRLTEALAPLALDDGRAELFRTLLRHLAEGRAVPIDAVARTLGWPCSRVTSAIANVPSIEVDEHGCVVSAGLSLRPTKHIFELDGRRLYTWCALDTLMFPAILVGLLM